MLALLPIALVASILGLPRFDPLDQSPVLTGIFPPGVSFGSPTTWTITGRHLERVTAILSSAPAGLKFGPPLVADSGRSLSVEVLAGEYAANGYLAIWLDGPAGISNPAIVRVDHLPQVVEVEPNDQVPNPAQAIAVGTAVAGVIAPLDVDRFRVEGTPGNRVTLDWETRRLGTAILPVLTITGPNGEALGQARSLPGGDRDCRHSVVIPPAGWFAVELRDNTYGGDDRARYRLRVDPQPFATSLFPLGGSRSEPLEVTFSGGSLAESIQTEVRLPSIAGSWFDPESFVPTATGTNIMAIPTLKRLQSKLLPPARLAIADPDWPELFEPANLPPGSSWLVTPGTGGVTINGRLDRPGQVDRFQVEVKAGDRFRARVEASTMGSWLDSVLTVLGPHGERLGENDDRSPASPLEPPLTIDGSPTTDSQVDVAITENGPITVELADRFGAGGPEYGYRLELGPPRIDFAMYLLRSPSSSDPKPEARSLAHPDVHPDPDEIGKSGVFNMPSDTTTRINLMIIPRGRLTGKLAIVVKTRQFVNPISNEVIRLASTPRPGSRAANVWDSPPLIHAIDLGGQPEASFFSVEAWTVNQDGPNLRRVADAVVGIDAAGSAERPVIRRFTSFPFRSVSGH